MSATLVQEGRSDQLAALIALGSALKVGLFTAPTTVSVTTTYGSITPASFSGYGVVSPTWGSITIDGNGNATVAGSTCTFTSSGASPTNTLYGYYVYDSTTGKLWYAEIFSAPILINASGQSVTITPTIYLGDCVPPL